MDYQNLIDYLVIHGIDIAYAFFIAIVGVLLSRRLKKLLNNYLKKQSNNVTLQLFIVNAVYVFALLILSTIVLSKIGIPTTSLTALLGAGSLAIGFALKDSLANVASGMILVFLRPFKIGDVIEIGGILGTVEQINLFNTQIKTPNNETVYIPNNKLATDKIINKTCKKKRRLDLEVGISYSADLVLAKQIIADILAEQKTVLDDPKATIGVKALADSAILFAVRPWVMAPDYISTKFAILEEVKLRFDKHGIEIPYPQLAVHLEKK